MGLVEVIIALVVLGIIIWAVNTYLPVDPRIKSLITMVAIAFVVIWFLQSMGWIPSLKGGANDISIR